MNLTPEQIKLIATDPVIREHIEKDKELERLFNQRKNEKSLDDIETLITIGAEMEIAGIRFPPPVTALFSFLEIIDSPFCMLNEDASSEPTRQDIERCLYIMKYRENAVSDIVEVKRLQLVLERIEPDITNSPETLMIYLSYQEKIAAAWKEFDRKVAEFAVSLGKYNIMEVNNKIFQYLSIAGGFDMLPQTLPEQNSNTNPQQPLSDKKKVHPTQNIIESSTPTGSPQS